MCILDEYIQNSLSVETLSKYVDDYSIYSFYIGEELELRTAYSSPLRTDDHPSFSLFEARDGRILFKDQAINLKGSVFQFVRYLLSPDKKSLIPFQDVLHQINVDFDVGLNGTSKTFKPRAKIIDSYKKKPILKKIEIVSKNYSPEFLTYFNTYGILEPILKAYNVFEVRMIKYKYKTHTSYYYPKTLCIAYKIGKYYKLYFPFEEKQDKFRSDFPESYAEGFIQLKYKQPFVIITKAMKEVLFFKQHFNFEAVAGKSETTMIKPFLMKKLFDNYEYVLLWLDRDIGGQKGTEAYLKVYPGIIPINYDSGIIQKDPTDRYKYLKDLNKQQNALDEIKEICQYSI